MRFFVSKYDEETTASPGEGKPWRRWEPHTLGQTAVCGRVAESGTGVAEVPCRSQRRVFARICFSY